MSARLIYVVGPSGAGKDSVMRQLKQRHDRPSDWHRARRTITREPDVNECNEFVEPEVFQQRLAQGLFALHWSAHGHWYGIAVSELEPLLQGRWVWVNGSRTAIKTLRQHFPAAVVVEIGISAEVQAKRMAERGRESTLAQQQRLARQPEWDMSQVDIRVSNDGTLEACAEALWQALRYISKHDP